MAEGREYGSVNNTTELKRPGTYDLALGVAATLGVLPKLASAVFGITASVYVLGYIEEAFYFGEMGAPWVVQMLTPPQVVADAGLISVVVVNAWLISTPVDRFWAIAHKVARASFLPMLLVSLSAFLSLGILERYSAKWASTASNVASMGGAVTVGFSLSMIASMLSRGYSRSSKLYGYICMSAILWARGHSNGAGQALHLLGKGSARQKTYSYARNRCWWMAFAPTSRELSFINESGWRIVVI